MTSAKAVAFVITAIALGTTPAIAQQPPPSAASASVPTASAVPVPVTVRQHLERRIDAIQHQESQIRAFVDTDFAGARREADRLNELNGFGLLYGKVVAVKDNIGVKGFRTTAGSAQLASVAKVGPAAADARAVQLLRNAGAIVIGTTNMDTWARGVRGVSEVRGQTANPLDPTRNAGGSSAGSAAAVAAGMVDLAIGTDTCGSIRYPASSVGIYGLKPTWGSVSLDGVVPLAPGQDVVGPLAGDVAMLRAGWRVISGSDARSVTSTLLLTRRVGVVSGMGKLNPQWVERARDAGLTFVDVGKAPSTAGVNLIELQFPIAQRAYIAWRKGQRDASWLTANGLIGSPPQQGPQRSVAANRARLAQQVTGLLVRYQLDALVYPANIAPPALIGARQASGNCMLASGSGLPAIVVPGLPAEGQRLAVGAEFIGRADSEAVLLQLAETLEAATPAR